IRMAQAEDHRAVSSHREPGDRPTFPMGNRSKRAIDVRDDLLHDPVLPARFGRLVRVHPEAPVALRHDEDDREIARLLRDADALPLAEVPAIAVQEVDHRIAPIAVLFVALGKEHVELELDSCLFDRLRSDRLGLELLDAKTLGTGEATDREEKDDEE